LEEEDLLKQAKEWELEEVGFEDGDQNNKFGKSSLEFDCNQENQEDLNKSTNRPNIRNVPSILDIEPDNSPGKRRHKSLMDRWRSASTKIKTITKFKNLIQKKPLPAPKKSTPQLSSLNPQNKDASPLLRLGTRTPRTRMLSLSPQRDPSTNSLINKHRQSPEFSLRVENLKRYCSPENENSDEKLDNNFNFNSIQTNSRKLSKNSQFSKISREEESEFDPSIKMMILDESVDTDRIIDISSPYKRKKNHVINPKVKRERISKFSGFRQHSNIIRVQQITQNNNEIEIQSVKNDDDNDSF